ncbi:transglycosylase SLT domain-containing protein [Streptomyces kebangsaanensis]|uniref:transglycosylase SLT domain-containing protein n=1 Tax=Streptomyces kebangsaanensis TaxID=864058 RepID=UPI000939A9B8|nr:transglycosylase SLT domain-containing protein [Streptomyces kebangsaanensis]
MPANFRLRAHSRALTKRRKLVGAGAAALAAAALAVSAAPSQAETQTSVAASAAPVQLSAQPIQGVKASVTDQLAADSVKIQAIEAKKQAAVKKAAAQAAAEKTVVKQASAKKARAAHQVKQSASRSAERPQMQTVAASTSYGNNLDGWIRQSLAIMKQHNIPGSYHGLHKNIMRESSGNPRAINNWDINARNGVPSKGLLQVIEPTFRAHHVPGTSHDIYDPVANITAAANYAAKRYGSIDNVNSAY